MSGVFNRLYDASGALGRGWANPNRVSDADKKKIASLERSDIYALMVPIILILLAGSVTACWGLYGNLATLSDPAIIALAFTISFLVTGTTIAATALSPFENRPKCQPYTSLLRLHEDCQADVIARESAVDLE